MIELNINNITKHYGATQIFESISMEIKTGEHIGLVGTNGCGKTTLMKILMGEEDCQLGEVSFRKGCKLGYLDQMPDYAEGTKSIEVIQMAFSKLLLLQGRMEELTKFMMHVEGKELEQALSRYSSLQNEYELGGGYEFETKINQITEGLHITEEIKSMDFQSLSGGEKTRCILAKLLLEEPDILLLDEPTNHLDLKTILWLEEFLKGYQGAALIVSHDRYFLDHVADKIMELHFDHVEVYCGNYTYYAEEKEKRFLIAKKDYENQQKKIERMEQQIERFRIWGAMRDSEAMYKRAKVIEKRLEKVEVLERPKLGKRKIRLNQAESERSGKRVVEMEAVRKSYGSRTLFQELDMQIYYQDSICILGENGCGKTTLLKMLLGEQAPDSGIIKIGAQVKIGYLPQHLLFQDEEQTILEYFSGTHNISYGEARTQLAKVLFFKEDVNKKIKILSGGEKSRLRLCSLTFEGTNFLILDEPTNHLDIESREVLEEMLLNFEGTILFVSHDRYFISKIADQIMEIEHGEATLYDGDYEYYVEEVRKQMNRQEEFKRNAENEALKRRNTSCSQKAVQQPEKLKKPNRKRIEVLEAKIEELEEEQRQLELLVSMYHSDSEKLNEIFVKKEMLDREIETVYGEWYLESAEN